MTTVIDAKMQNLSVSTPVEKVKKEKPFKTCAEMGQSVYWFKTASLYDGAQNIALEFPFFILSVDPGTSAFYIRIEERTSLEESKTIVWKGFNFKAEKEENKRQTLANYISRCHYVLEGYKSLILKCSLLLVEEQIQLNYNTCRESTSILSLLLSWFATSNPAPWIGEINVNLKSYFLSGTKKKREELKELSLEYTMRSLTKRGDIEGLNHIKSIKTKKAKFDPSDTLTQIDAVIRYLFGKLIFDGDIWQ